MTAFGPPGGPQEPPLMGNYGANPSNEPPGSPDPLDLSVVAAGVLAVVFSFISYYTASADASGSCPSGTQQQADQVASRLGSETAWHGFFGWFGILLAAIGAVLIAITMLSPRTKVPARLLALILFAVGTLSLLIAVFVPPESDQKVNIGGGCSVTVGVSNGFGFWASLVVVVLGLVAAFLSFQRSRVAR